MPLWSERRLISLWQMITEYPVVQFWWLSHELLRLEVLLRQGVPEVAEITVTEANPPGLTEGLVAEIEATIAFAEGHCKNFDFSDTAMLPLNNVKMALDRIRILRRNAPDCSTDIARDLKELRKTIRLELLKRRFVYVSPEKSKYFAQDQIFGKQVFDAFPSARFDLANAGDCLACGLNSAAAFHLMRAAEIGLWELAIDRQVARAAKIEYMDWGAIIRDLEQEVQKIQQWTNSPAKEEAHIFYNRSLVDIRSFNDGWRRHIAHVRKTGVPLADDEAFALAGHVERFLKTLATKISEGSHTPLEWI